MTRWQKLPIHSVNWKVGMKVHLSCGDGVRFDHVNRITNGLVFRYADGKEITKDRWSGDLVEVELPLTWETLGVGDEVLSGDQYLRTTVLARIEDSVLLSLLSGYSEKDQANGWFTIHELKRAGYTIVGADPEPETVEVLGKKYLKEDVEKAVKDLRSV